MCALTHLPHEYAQWPLELKSLICSSRIKVSRAVNRELVVLYWRIGRQIIARQTQQVQTKAFMNQTLATFLGFAVASIIPAAYLAVAFPLSGIRDAESIIRSFAVFYYFSAVTAVFLGVSFFLLMKKMKLVNFWSATLCGAFVGCAALVAITFVESADRASLLTHAILGAVSGSTFWVVRQLGRSEKTNLRATQKNQP